MNAAFIPPTATQPVIHDPILDPQQYQGVSESTGAASASGSKFTLTTSTVPPSELTHPKTGPIAKQSDADGSAKFSK
jgi:hypothetical protein